MSTKELVTLPQAQVTAERDFNSLDEMVEAYVQQGVLNEQERELLMILLEPDARLVLVVPDDPDVGEVWEQLRVCARVHGTLVRAEYAIKPVIGRLLNVIKKNPRMFQEKGYDTYTGFIVEWVPRNLLVSRSEAWKIKGVAECFPSMTPRRTLEIGYSKLVCMSKFIDEKHPSFPRLCEIAPKMNMDDFYRVVIEEAKRDYREDAPVNITIKSTIAISEKWREFCNNKYVQAVVESRSPSKILEAAIQECIVEWVNMGREKMRLEREAQRENLAGERIAKAAQGMKRTDLGSVASAIDEALGEEE
jgi:hypothetical protein